MKILYTLISFAMLQAVAISQSFYDEDKIQTISIEFEQSNWDALLDEEKAGDENYIMAKSVTINGVEFDSVGVKYKGNSTYRANQTKNPLHIELDTYKDHKYELYTDIKLSNVAKDPSYLREVLSYKILRNYMDAPLSNYANVYINGTLYGLYTNSESISKKFVDSRFGSKSNTFVKCNPVEGAGPGSKDFPNLVYLGDDSTAYYSRYEIKSEYGWSELIDLCDTLKNNMVDIEKILDVDRALWMLAFNSVVVNLDSYSGQFTQNYYLYRDDTQRFLPVIWDLNESFGTFSSTGNGRLRSTDDKIRMDHLLHSNDSSYPLISQLLSVPTYRKMFLAHCKTMLVDNFTENGLYYQQALELQNIIDADVKADPNNFYTYEDFKSNLTSSGPGASSAPGITVLMNGRYTYLMGLSDFSATEPTISEIQTSTDLPMIGDRFVITAKIVNEDVVSLRYRTQDRAVFSKIEMFDDGKHNDGNANDDIFGAEVTMTSATMEYYIYAENDSIGKFSPTNAEHEFYSVKSVVETAESDLVINEVLASNDVTKVDQDGDYDDWVELYNNGSEAIELEGYTLTDDITDFTSFVFPAGTVIQPDEYIIVWADKDDEQEGYHADFKVSASGETIFLTNAELSIIDSVNFGAQETDISYGRFPNGTGGFRIMTPTFDEENISTITNINDFTFEEGDVSIFPNPANNVINLELHNTTSGTEKIKIYNEQRKLVYTNTIEQHLVINTEKWVTGVYFVVIGTNLTKLFIE